VRRAARDLSGADGVTFVLREGDLVHYADEEAIGPLWKGHRFPASACISGWAILHRQSVVIEDIYADPRIPADAYRPTFVKSLAMVPIRTEDPVGAIGAYWATRRRATPREVELLEALASATAVAIENARLYLEAQAAVRARDEFLLRASHELRTPLTSVLATVRLLTRAMAGQLTETPEALVEIASRNLGVAIGLLNDLLDASKLLVGGERPAPRPVVLSAAVQAAREVVDPEARAGGVAVRTLVPVDLRVSADPLKLEQVLVNLLANAVKFTQAGGSVVVDAVAQEGDRQPSVLVRVRDTGRGIRPEHLERVFEPFFQAEGATAPARAPEAKRRGTGLGLAICRQIAELHGGRIWAESEGPGRGSTFVLRLPTLPAGRQAA